MATAAEMRALAERIEREPPAYMLDQAVFGALNGWSVPLIGSAVTDWRERGSPAYLTSIDAILAEVAGKRWWFLIGAGKTRADEPLYGAQILLPDETLKADVIGEGEHPTSLAAAFTAAYLRALAGEEP